MSIAHRSHMFKVPLRGLVGWFPMREGTGTSTRDWAGGSAGTLTNGPTWGAVGGRPNAVTFDGTDDWISVPNAGPINPGTYISFGGWLYPTANAGTYYQFMIKPFVGSPGGNEQFTIFKNAAGAGNITAGIKAGGSMAYAAGTTWTSLQNTWTLAIATYDGSNLRMYINGVLQNTTAKTGALNTDSEVMGIGGHSSAAFADFVGSIGPCYIWNRPLDASEMLQMTNNRGAA